jgi:hypothetical protein
VEVKGALYRRVFLLKSAEEIDTTTTGSTPLILAVAVVLPVMLLLSSLSERRLAEPLPEGEVAIKMRGRFASRG